MMKLSRLLWCGAVMAAVAASPARAAEDRSPAARRGKVVAPRVCAGCHDVSDDLKAAAVRHPGEPPPFLTVATSAKLDVDLLVAFLWFPHGEMDNLVMTRPEAEDVAAYIMSLRRK